MATVDPVPEKDEKETTMYSRRLEPVEDEYHGRIIVDAQTTFPRSSNEIDQPFSSHTDCESDGIVMGSSRAAIDRLAMLESKMEIYDRSNQTTQRELMNTKNQIGQIETNRQKSTQMEAQLAQLRIQSDLAKLEQEKEGLLVENEKLRQQMVHQALGQAEIERRMLMNFDKRLGEELAELKNALVVTCKERDQVKYERDQTRIHEKSLKRERENLQRDRDNWRKKSTEADKQIASLSSNLKRKDDMLVKKEKVLIKFEEQCKVISNENTRLQRENGFLRSTLFHCVQVDASDISGEISASKLEFVCYSCQATYKPSMQTHLDKNCQFHPLPPMQYREWKLWPIGQDVKENDMSKLYWPCCDTLTYSRPDGCSHGRHHQSWERDIIMKTALSDKLDHDNGN